MRGVAVQPDGKIAVAGRGRDDYAIARLEVDGDVDGTTFELDGSQGVVTIDALALDGEGAHPRRGIERRRAVRRVRRARRHVRRRWDRADAEGHFAGLRHLDRGRRTDRHRRRRRRRGLADVPRAPDRQGGHGHHLRLRRHGGSRVRRRGVSAAVARRADGKLLLVGTTMEGGVSMAVSRYDTKGAPDTSYGNAGRLTLALGFPAAAGDAAIRPDGRLVVAGAVDVGTNDPRPAIARLLATPPVQDPGPGGGAGPGGGDPGPGADPVTPTIPMCAGRPATIVGAARGETLRGTAGDDVIVTRGGADRVRAPSWSRHRLRRWRARRALRRPEWTETINRAAGTDPAPPERQTAPSPPSCTIPVIVSSSVRMPGRRRRQAARRTHALARRSRRPARQG